MSRLFFKNNAFIAAALILMTTAAQAAEPEKTADTPIVITADRMEAEKLGDIVTFIGNVVLKREDMTLSSDRMVVFYDEGTKDIREIDASGSVIVRKEGRLALSQKAFYYSREEKIVLTGDARIIENENELGGEKITLFMRDDRSIIEGGKVLLYPDKAAAKPEGPSKRKKQE